MVFPRNMENTLWGMVLMGIPLAYDMALLGLGATKSHDVVSHTKWVTVSCTLVMRGLTASARMPFICVRD